MDHKSCMENLSAYMDNELPAEAKASVEEHLSKCVECRKLAHELRAVSGLVKKHGLEPIPLSLRNKVLNPAEERKERAVFAPWFKPVLGVSFAAAGVFLVLNFMGKTGKAPVTGLYLSGAADSMSERKASPPASAYEPRLFGETKQKTSSALGMFTGKPASLSSGRRKARGRGMMGQVRGKAGSIPRGDRKGAYGQAKYAAKSSSLKGAIASAAPSFEWSGVAVSPPDETAAIVIKTAASWLGLWPRLSGKPLPIVDFEKSMVLVIMESGASGTASPKILRIRVENGNLMVYYAKGSGGRYHVKVAPKSDLAVIFKITK